MTQKIEYKGNIIEFDDNTSVDEVIKILNQSDIKENTAPTNFADNLRLGGQGLALGYGDEITAGARSLFSDRSYDDLLKEERDRIANFKKAKPKTALALELAGGILSPVAKLGLVAKAPTIAKKGLQLAKEGGKVGFVYGTGTGEGLKDRLKSGVEDATIGAVANPVLSKAIKTITPKVTDEAKKFVERFDIEPSESQKIGGIAKKTEELIESVPISGQLIQKKRLNTIDKAINRLVNESVKKIDKTISPKITSEKAIEKADDLFDDAYDEILPQMKISDKGDLQSFVVNTIGRIQQDFPDIGKERIGKIKRDFSKILQSFNIDGVITGNKLQKWNTDFNKLRKQYNKDFILDDVANEYFDDFKRTIYEKATANKPDVLANWKKIQEGYSDFGTFADLSKKQNKITPQNIKKRAFDRGRSKQAEGAKLIQKVLSSTTPDSGTSQRLANILGLLNPKMYLSSIPALLYNPAIRQLNKIGRGESANVLPPILSDTKNQGLLNN